MLEANNSFGDNFLYNGSMEHTFSSLYLNKLTNTQCQFLAPTCRSHLELLATICTKKLYLCPPILHNLHNKGLSMDSAAPELTSLMSQDHGQEKLTPKIHALLTCRLETYIWKFYVVFNTS